MDSFEDQFAQFHEQAMQACNLSDFGPDDYVEPMKLALADYDRHSVLNDVGHGVIQGSVVGMLVARLLAEEGFKRYPDFANAPIRCPLIIIGQLRSGTTALLQLLSKDPHNQWLPPWLGSAPMPRPPRDSWESNPWYQAVTQGIDTINKLCPVFEETHVIRADQPDECRFALQQSFWSPTIPSTTSAPNYARWCLDADARGAFQRYHRLLGLIGGDAPQRWLLKDPCHLWALDALIDTFPDACIVYIHRQPELALASAANMIFEFRQMLGAQPRETVGREQIAMWARAQARAEQVRERYDDGRRFCDVRNEDLQRDPIGTAELIYRHFDLPVSDDTCRAWQAHVASGQRAGRTPHPLAIGDFGVASTQVREWLGPYHDRYESLK